MGQPTGVQLWATKGETEVAQTEPVSPAAHWQPEKMLEPVVLVGQMAGVQEPVK